MPPQPPKPRPYLSDQVQPLTAEKDYFGHADYAETLARESKSVQTPFTLGLFAPWGTGKSTILDGTKERLNKDDEVAAVVFDVWKYEGDSLRRAFITDIARGLEAGGKLDRKFKLEKHLQRLEADVSKPEPALKLDARPVGEALWRATLAALVVGLVLFVGPHLGLKDEGATKLLVALASGLATYILAALAKTVRTEDIQVTHKQLQDPDQFARSFEELVRNGVAAQRLVVAVDNLDRCSPARVTELLATIKTFLEPVKTGKDLVFIIAADDAALRRHLVAQELAASGGKSTSNASGEGDAEAAPPDDPDEARAPPSVRRVPQEVQNAVDEYLRKFFNGTLRLTEVLDEDIRGFAQAQLEAFITSHDMNEADSSQLVELVATALKQNPRRIKQFINGLELRLQLLAARRASKRIQLEPNILVVAKLAIIEEEWNDRFEDLRRNPRLLSDWHEQARDGHDDEDDDPYSRWQVFLRNTEGIPQNNLRPYLTLKQSRRELQLPRYQEFVDALEDGRVDGLEEFLADDDVAAQREEYIKAIPDRLREAIRDNFKNAAANIVRSAIQAPSLQPHGASVLIEAMRTPPLRERLGQLPPEALISAASGLNDGPFNDVAETLIGRFEGTEEASAEGRLSVSEALAPVLGRLDGPRKSKLIDALGSDEIKKDFGSTVVIAEADPSLVPEDAVTAALDSLDADEAFGPASPAYRIAKASLNASSEPPFSQIQKLGEVTTKALLQHTGTEEAVEPYMELAGDAARVIRRFDVPRTSFKDPVEQLDAQWPQIPAELHSATVDFVGALLDAGTEEAREQFSGPLVDRFFREDRGSALAWAEQRSGDFGRAFEAPVLKQLALQLSGSPDEAAMIERGLGVVQALEDTVKASVISDAIGLAIQHDRPGRAVVLIKQFSALQAEDREVLIDRLLKAAEADSSADQQDLLTAISNLPPSELPAEIRARQAALVAQAVIHEHGGWREAYDQLVADSAFEADATEIASQVFDHVTSDAASIPNRVEQVTLVAGENHRLTDAKRRQLGTVLVDALKQWPQGYPAQPMAPVAAALGKLESVDATQRNGWVTDLIVLERQHGDLNTRKALLNAAVSLAGRKNSKAFGEVKDRLKDLKKSGSEEEKALAQELEANL